MRVDRGVTAGTTFGVSIGVASGGAVGSDEGSYAGGRGSLSFAGGHVGFIVGVHVDEVTVASDSIIILKAA